MTAFGEGRRKENMRGRVKRKGRREGEKERDGSEDGERCGGMGYRRYTHTPSQLTVAVEK